MDTAIAPKYHCGICHNVLRDARLTECCGQNFCDSCLTEWLKKQGGGKSCPHCRQMSFKSFINKEKIREINEFRIRCTHRKKGCDWVGKLEDIEQHLDGNDGCGYVVVKCTNDRCRDYHVYLCYPATCGEAIERRYLSDHQKNKCKYRQYTCEYCGHVDTYDAIAGTGMDWGLSVSFDECHNHYDRCDQFPLKCPNKCGEKEIKRKDVDSHRKTCPLEPLDCPFKTVGCKDEISRKDMEHHTQKSVQSHLLLVVQSHQELARKNDELTEKMEKFNNELSACLEKIEGKHPRKR